MACCKICGRPVRCGPVFHPACWQTAVTGMAEIFCDDYCRWPRECADEELLEELHCNNCPLVAVLNLGL